MRSALVCTGSDGAGYPFDNARCCAVCGVAFPDVSRVPTHFVREIDPTEFDEIVKGWNG